MPSQHSNPLQSADSRVFGSDPGNRPNKLLDGFEPEWWTDPERVRWFTLWQLDRLAERAERVGNFHVLLVCLRLAARISPPPPHAQERLDA